MTRPTERSHAAFSLFFLFWFWSLGPFPISNADEVPPVPIGDLEEVNKAWQSQLAGFRQFQEEMLQRRAEGTPELQKILRRKIHVPPPGEPVGAVEEVTPFWERLELELSGRLVGEFRIGREEGAHISVTGKRGITVSTAKPEIAFESEAEVEATWGLASASVDHEGTAGLGLNFGIYALRYSSDGKKSFESDGGVSWWEVAVKPNEISGTVGQGVALSPSDFLRLKLGIEQELAVSWAHEVASGLAFAAHIDSSHRWATEREVEDSVRLVIREPMSCPLCRGEGNFRCPRCDNVLTVACPQCSQTGQIACSTCGQKGQVSCPTNAACSSCAGDGYLACVDCGGSGRISEMEQTSCSRCGGSGWVITSEYFPSMGYLDVAHGCTACGGTYGDVDSHGNVTGTPGSGTSYTWTSDACSTCSGSGQGEGCETCNVSGWVPCSICYGSGVKTCTTCGGGGQLTCRTCGASGRIPCAFCGGHPLECKLCHGAQRLEPARPRPRRRALPAWGQLRPK